MATQGRGKPQAAVGGGAGQAAGRQPAAQGAQGRAGVGQGAGPKMVPMSPADALATAAKLYTNGRYEQAASLCERIIERRANWADAHNLHGVVLKMLGKDREAIRVLKKAVQLSPQSSQFWSNLGEVERQAGKIDDAMRDLNRAVALDPQSAQARNNLGICHFECDEFEEAAACYLKAIEINGSYPEAHNNLGNAYRALGRREEAVDQYQHALLLREAYPEAYNNLATVLREDRRTQESEHAYRKAIQLRPKYIDAYNNLVLLLMGDHREDEALRVLGEALKVDDKHPATLLSVARVQCSKGNYDQAEQACRLTLKYDPTKAEAHSVLGSIYMDLDRFEDAIRELERAIEVKPDLGEAHNLLGVVYKSVGRLEDAKVELRKAVELNPKGYGSYANLVDVDKIKPGHDILLKMEELYEAAPDKEADAVMPLHFALGKAYDDMGEHARAFTHFATGARLKRSQLSYEEDKVGQFFDEIRETFSAERLADPPYEGLPTDKPVFIVGMPRSGSTLVEQIIQSHPQAFGAGEIKVFSRVLNELRGRFPALPKYPQIVDRMNHAQFEIVATRYAGETAALAPEAKRITDKLLSNYYFVGLLHILFPRAKFVHTRRDPVDTCLSAFTKLFKDDMPHSYDLGELGRYYRRYETLMQHWESALPPGVMMTVQYEQVVDDVEGNARRILDFIGLDWDPACLAFHESSRPVKTASVVQVRQPVYRSSVERWRRYGEALNPLLDSLGISRAA